MKITSVFVAFLAVALSQGCSSTESKDPGPGTGTPTPGSTTPAPSDTTPPDTTPPAAVVKAPTIDEVAKMVGALHVMWTNAEPACDSIELERKTATVPFKLVATLPGEADNKHDATASEATMYTYRARCKKAAAYSAYSNEMSGTP